MYKELTIQVVVAVRSRYRNYCTTAHTLWCLGLVNSGAYQRKSEHRRQCPSRCYTDARERNFSSTHDKYMQIHRYVFVHIVIKTCPHWLYPGGDQGKARRSIYSTGSSTRVEKSHRTRALPLIFKEQTRIDKKKRMYITGC